MVQVEDLEGAIEGPNLPGTIDEHPNWRRRMLDDLERLLEAPLAGRLVEVMARERPRRG
jgi:4-alpha-glucanotransferase